MGDSQVVQPARERLLAEMREALDAVETELNSKRDSRDQGPLSHREAAEICLSVIERPSDPASETIIPCTCGQNGYASNSPHSNHPHFPGCLHYDEALFSTYKAALPIGRIPHNHVTRDIKPVGQCPGCDLYHAGNPRETK